MPDYRLYCLNGDSHIAKGEWIEAKNDDGQSRSSDRRSFPLHARFGCKTASSQLSKLIRCPSDPLNHAIVRFGWKADLSGPFSL